MSRGSPSLVGRLLIAQIAPLALLGAALALAGALAAHQVVEKASDRLLAGSVASIVAQIDVEDGRAKVALPPWSLGLLDSPERDAVFYAVRQGPRLITGYGDLPRPPPPPPNETGFAYAEMRGYPVRIAQSTVMAPGVREPVVVAVAQSLDSRRASVRELQFNFIVLPLLLVFFAAALVIPAVRWGLAPLRSLTEDLTRRAASGRPDFTPVRDQDAPAELSSVVGAFNRLMLSLERFTRALERFSADASHQLRTPLSVIVANLALLERSVAAAPQKALIEDSMAAAANLRQVLTQFLALARSEATATEGETDLADLIAAVGHDARRAFPEVEVRYRTPPGVVVAGNPTLVGELLRNLVFNACAYGGGAVFALVVEEPDGWRALIWDHGTGVDPAKLDTFFAPFSRGDSAGNESGAGLGLTIVQTIARRLNIRIDLRARGPGSGLVADLRFQRPARSDPSGQVFPDNA